MLPSAYKIVSPETPAEFEKYYRLRWEVLRKPWNQPIGSEKDSMEHDSCHAMLIDDRENVLAVCRLQLNDLDTGQIRFMAVDPAMQGKGLGKLILNYQEEQARKLDLKKIILDARENAVEFYKNSGYTVLSAGHVLYNTIQHYKMEKSLS